MNCHCGKRLVLNKELEKKGRTVYTCTCGCSYSLIRAYNKIVRSYKSVKCAKKENGKPLTKPKPKKKRGRKKKNYLTRKD